MIASKLKKAGLKFKWYIVGGGSDDAYRMLENLIDVNMVKDEVILLGVKKNPYPFIRFADLLVVTSRYESYPTVINEAKVLGLSVLTSDFNGVHEIVDDADDWVCPVEMMADLLIKKISSGEIVRQHRNNNDFLRHNHEIIKTFERILGDVVPTT